VFRVSTKLIQPGSSELNKGVCCEQIGALSDHYLLVRRGHSAVSKRLSPKHTATLNADPRVSCYDQAHFVIAFLHYEAMTERNIGIANLSVVSLSVTRNFCIDILRL